MKILFATVGTRGDAEPFLAMAKLCRERGDDVVCALPAQLTPLAEEAGIRSLPLTHAFLDLLESPEGRLVMGGKGSPFAKMAALIRLYRASNDIGVTLVEELRQFVHDEAPDRVVHHPKATYPMLLEAKRPGSTVMVCPVPFTVVPTDERPHIGFPFNGGRYLNRLSYRLAHRGLMRSLRKTSAAAFAADGVTLDAVEAAASRRATVFSVSPTLFPRPERWPAHVKVLGFRSRDGERRGALPEGLSAFLERHPRVVLVSFGSMVGPSPYETTETIVRVLESLGVAAVLNLSSGGLVRGPSTSSERMWVTESVSYDALLPRVHAAVHHGGSGTTHQSLRHGCPTLVVPHMIDQYVWADIVASRGAGPKGLPIGKFDARRFEERVRDLLETESYASCAKAMAERMANEDFDDELYRTIVDPHASLG